MRLLLAATMLAVALPDRPLRSPPTVRTPQEQILGDWHYIGNGPASAAVPAQPNMVFRITPTESMWMTNGQVSQGNGFNAKITFDWTKTPVAWDMMPQHGGAPLRGILRLEGDRLLIAWSSDQNRPVDFVAPHNIHLFTRVKS